jgi:Type III restriction enzyme, res subunit
VIQPLEGWVGTVVDGAELVPLLDEAGLRPPEKSLSVATFSPRDLDETAFWLKLGLPQRPRFLTLPKSTPDSVLVASDRRFVFLVRDGVSERDRHFLIRHAFGHIALGHIRLGDDVAHWDLLAQLKNATPLRRWDAQVAAFLTGGNLSPSESFFTEGLAEVAARLHVDDLDAPWLSAALLHKSYEDEIVEVPRALAEHAQLFPHQERGIAELLARLRRFNVSVLADSVGLGKTRTTCAAIRSLRDQQQLTRAVILAPRKLERNWRIEFAVVGLEEGSDVVLVNKDSFKRLTPQEAARSLRGFGLVVVEEAHQVSIGTRSLPRLGDRKQSAAPGPRVDARRTPHIVCEYCRRVQGKAAKAPMAFARQNRIGYRTAAHSIAQSAMERHRL